MPLTDLRIRAVKPTDRPQKQSDGGGLFLEVAPSGVKTWRQNYRYDGSQRTVTHGVYPGVSLAEARALREVVKAKLRRGKDPKEGRVPRAPEHHPEPETDTPVEDSVREYLRRYLEKRAREGAAPATMSKLNVHAQVILASMGEMRIGHVGAQDVIRACRHYEEKDMLNSAHAVRTLLSQMFRFAIAHGVVQFDPAAPTRDAIARPPDVGHPGVTDPKRVGELMRAIRAYDGNPSTRSGLLLSAYLFPRSGEIRRMEWSQIDGDLWTVPAAIMKKKREHLVPLPGQALEVLAYQKQITGRNKLVLQSRASNSGLISENTFNKALRLIGFPKTEHVHHGFRITASTNLHEQGWNSDWIESQLAHVQENKIKGIYNKAFYLKDRAKMMQSYADWLDEQERSASS